MTHDELVTVAYGWLRKAKGCGVAVPELVSVTTEIPDAIGFKSGYSILVECKVSRSDFLSDKKKYFRIYPELGMGDFRFYMCPKGLIKKDELPDKWGLIYVDDELKARQVVGGKGNISSNWASFRFRKSIEDESRLMYSLLRRVEINGDLTKVFSNPKFKINN